MSKTKQVYQCFTCSEFITFHGPYAPYKARYNADGSLHLCKADDKLAYEKYRASHTHVSGENFWKWKREIYDVQRWKQSSEYYNELLEQRRKAVEDEQKHKAAAHAEQRRSAAAEEEQRRADAERAAEEQRKQAAREKRRAARQRRKQREQEEAAAAAAEEERHRQQQNRRRSRRATGTPRGGRELSQALRIMQLTLDIFRLPLKEAKTIIKNKFRALALKLHPDRGGNATEFRLMNEAYEYLMRRCTA